MPVECPLCSPNRVPIIWCAKCDRAYFRLLNQLPGRSEHPTAQKLVRAALDNTDACSDCHKVRAQCVEYQPGGILYKPQTPE